MAFSPLIITINILGW